MTGPGRRPSSWMAEAQRRAPAGFVEDLGRVDGRLVRSLRIGTVGDLPPVVLLPGLGAPGYLLPLMERLGRWTEATVLDLPGWHAHRGRWPSTVDGVAEAAARWLEAHDVDQVVLFGHSSGAQSALQVALREPRRLAGLVLAGPTLDQAARRPWTLARRVVTTLARESLDELPAVLPWYARSGGGGWLRLVRSAVTDRPEELIWRLRVPLLLVSGASDPFAPPQWAERLASLASQRSVLIPGAHNIPYTNPDELDAAIRGRVQLWSSGTDSAADRKAQEVAVVESSCSSPSAPPVA